MGSNSSTNINYSNVTLKARSLPVRNDLHVANASGYDIRIFSHPEQMSLDPTADNSKTTSCTIPANGIKSFSASDVDHYITIQADTTSSSQKWSTIAENFSVTRKQSIIVTKDGHIKFHKKGDPNFWIDEEGIDHKC